MIKVKSFVLKSFNSLHNETLDLAINKFIQDEKISDIIDIKYSSSMCGGGSAPICWKSSALLIYRTEE